MDLELLKSQHRDISETSRQLAAATIGQAEPVSVGRLRWQLARQLMAHLALEDQCLYPALHRSPDPDLRAQAARLQTETGALAETFSDYMRTWSEDRMMREWPAFCADTARLLRALNDRIGREENSLYPMMEQGARHKAASPA